MTMEKKMTHKTIANLISLAVAITLFVWAVYMMRG